MKISLESRNPNNIPEYWAAGRKRLATITGVSLINDRTLVCISLVGQAMYLVDFDLGSNDYRIVQRIDTVAGTANVCADLLAFDGRDRLATSNCEASSLSFYRLGENQIRYESELRIPRPYGGFCHGVAFVPDSDLICVTVQSGGQSVQLWSRSSGELIGQYADPDWWPKDAVFVDSTTMLVLFSRTAAQANSKQNGGSKVALVEFSADYKNQTLHQEWVLGDSQFDSLRHSSGDVFISDQGNDQVHHYLLGEQLAHRGCFDGYNFPHGIDFDAKRNLLAVTNYGDNSVELRHIHPRDG